MTEKFAENKKTIQEILKLFSIQNQSKFDLRIFEGNSHASTLDLFPKIIDDRDKYKQAEIYYQKALDNQKFLKEFERAEEKFHQFIKTLWLYNPVYTQLPLLTEPKDFYKNYYLKKNKHLLKSEQGFLHTLIHDSENSVYPVPTLEKLSFLSTLATRTISPVLFCFLKDQTMIYLYDCCGLVYIKNLESKKALEQFAKEHSLYLL